MTLSNLSTRWYILSNGRIHELPLVERRGLQGCERESWRILAARPLFIIRLLWLAFYLRSPSKLMIQASQRSTKWMATLGGEFYEFLISRMISPNKAERDHGSNLPPNGSHGVYRTPEYTICFLFPLKFIRTSVNRSFVTSINYPYRLQPKHHDVIKLSKESHQNIKRRTERTTTSCGKIQES